MSPVRLDSDGDILHTMSKAQCEVNRIACLRLAKVELVELINKIVN